MAVAAFDVVAVVAVPVAVVDGDGLVVAAAAAAAAAVGDDGGDDDALALAFVDLAVAVVAADADTSVAFDSAVVVAAAANHMVQAWPSVHEERRSSAAVAAHPYFPRNRQCERVDAYISSMACLHLQNER